MAPVAPHRGGPETTRGRRLTATPDRGTPRGVCEPRSRGNEGGTGRWQNAAWQQLVVVMRHSPLAPGRSDRVEQRIRGQETGQRFGLCTSLPSERICRDVPCQLGTLLGPALRTRQGRRGPLTLAGDEDRLVFLGAREDPACTDDFPQPAGLG
jgi:hypothetical protein